VHMSEWSEIIAAPVTAHPFINSPIERAQQRYRVSEEGNAREIMPCTMRSGRR